ncbi:MAG: hypothetical protein K8H88_30550, partial [Sandaracinaceae bacterium]|nr:hypothetical protein [Sandaracinaceae bacterium]
GTGRVPIYDAHGLWRSVLARRVLPGKGPKSVAGRGERRGLVIANPAARRMLAGELASVERVVVAEGEMDALTFALVVPEGTPVIGLFSGAWSAEHGARIPDGAVVLIATHHDESGHGYARHVLEDLHPRLASGALRAERWRPR